MSNDDFAAANNFINWLIDLIKTVSDFIKRLFGKEEAAPEEEANEG